MTGKQEVSCVSSLTHSSIHKAVQVCIMYAHEETAGSLISRGRNWFTPFITVQIVPVPLIPNEGTAGLLVGRYPFHYSTDCPCTPNTQ